MNFRVKCLLCLRHFARYWGDQVKLESVLHVKAMGILRKPSLPEYAVGSELEADVGSYVGTEEA